MPNSNDKRAGSKTGAPILPWMQKEVAAYDLVMVPPPKSILDIGANIGAYTLRCAERYPDAHISAFEPVEATYKILRENTRHLSNFSCSHMAVRAEGGVDHIFLGDHAVTCSFHQRGRQTQLKEKVHCLAAELVRPAELVKIDTEGCEVEILKHLNLDGTRAVVVEYHSIEDMEAIMSFLHAAGFKLLHCCPAEIGYGILKFARDPGVTLPEETKLEDGGLKREDGKAKQRKVYLAIAGHYANNDVTFVQSLIGLVARPTVSIAFGWSCDPSVERARNILTANFLESDCTHILFVDSDIGFTPADVARVCSHDELVVGGCYPLKTMTPEVQWCGNGLQPGLAPIREDGLCEVKYAGTGFLCIARAAFEKLAQYHYVLSYTQDFPPHRAEKAFWFQRVFAGRFLTEDWNFCQMCQECDIKIFFDSKVVLRHAGRAEWPLPFQAGNPFVKAESPKSESDPNNTRSIEPAIGNPKS